jgi:TRAP-type transport system small permease protein
MEASPRRSPGPESAIHGRIAGIVRMMSYVGAAFIAVMALLNIGDVAGRFFFDRPIKGSYELIALLLACGGTWGMGHCESLKKHISIGIMVDRLPPRVQAAFDVFNGVAALGIFTFIAWQMFIRVPHGTLSDDLGIPMGIFYMFYGLGLSGYCLVLMANLAQSIARLCGRSPWTR